MEQDRLTSEIADALTQAVDADYLLPEARDLLRRVAPGAEFTDDEILVLALAAAQAALAKHVEPGHADAEATLKIILEVLHHRDVVQVQLRRLHTLIDWRRKRAIQSREVEHVG